ncbi:MAG: hypothetical protein ACRDSP_22665 [Pseudonocardiaceae bacterium]
MTSQLTNPDTGVIWTSQLRKLHTDIVGDGFVRYCCGPRTDPVLLLAYYEWPGFVDLVTIRNYERITAARILRQEGRSVDVFAPKLAVWAYQGPAEDTLRALLRLPHPAHPGSPTEPFPAPPALRVDRRDQRPLSIKLPPPEHRHARARRLADRLLTQM